MPLETIAEANKYSTTQLRRGVVEVIVDEAPLFSVLPYDAIQGNSLTYNRESVLAGAQFFAPGDTWVEDTVEVVQKTATLKIAGGDADVDNFLARTRSNINDLRANAIASKSKSVARLVQEELVYGDTDDDALGFNGLHAIITDDAAGQQVHAGATTVEGAGSLTELQEMMQLIKPGKPDFLMGPRAGIRQIGKIARSLGSANLIEAVRLDMANVTLTVDHFDGIPYLVNDFQTITETISSGAYATKTGGTGYTIFACKVGEDGVVGLDDGVGLEVIDLGDLETKDAKRARVRWYTALALYSTLAIARYDGIDVGQDWTN